MSNTDSQRLDAMRRQRDGYRNQLRKAEPTKEKTMPDTQLNPDAIKAARLVYGGLTECESASDCDECQVEAGEIIRAYLDVAQPEVNSVEELDQLPMHSYVQGNDGFKHAKDWKGGWHLIVNRPSSAPHLSGSIELPALVLYRPEVKP